MLKLPEGVTSHLLIQDILGHELQLPQHSLTSHRTKDFSLSLDTAMASDFCPLLNQDSKSHFEFDMSSISTDLGYYSACSSLSPTSSIDSSCFSPPACQWGGGYKVQNEEKPRLDPLTFSRRRTRSKNPGKKRQSASEREKLRMRDLTKALHHLRTYLPTSVAPAGQTLTKIETLRLTIRYISQLSAQLGLDEEVSPARNSQSCSISHPLQQDVNLDTWGQTRHQHELYYSSETCQQPTTIHNSGKQRETNLFSSTDYMDTQFPMFPSHNGQSYTHCDLEALL